MKTECNLGKSALASLAALILAAAANGQTDLKAKAKQSNQQHVDGSAEAYAAAATDKAVVPVIEEKDGKKYYTWPMWNESKNRKMQVLRERTTHPDAQWWPHAGLGLFMHWGIISEFEPSGEAWSGRWTQAREDKGVNALVEGRHLRRFEASGEADVFLESKFGHARLEPCSLRSITDQFDRYGRARDSQLDNTRPRIVREACTSI